MKIEDYIKWRGDIPLKVSAFNEVDSLVICDISYVLFEKCIDLTKRYRIDELADTFFSKIPKDVLASDKSFISGSPFIFEKMASCERFKDTYLYDFECVYNEDKTEQFFAFSLDLPDNTTFIVFRGTDDTLLGWKEDFNLSYTTIFAQKEALNYLNKHIKGRKKYRVGGHSKGGNLAEYACVWLKEKKQNKIINIYSHDGPGNKSDFLPSNYEEIFERLSNKLVKYVPEFDIFGAIYNNKYDPIVIKADGIAFMQHSAENWLVDVNMLERGEKSSESLANEKAFKEFLNSVSIENKKKFVDDLFAALGEAGLENISDFEKGGLSVFIKTLKNYNGMNDESKEVGSKLIKIFLKQYKEKFAGEADELKDNLVKSVKNVGSGVVDKITEIIKS